MLTINLKRLSNLTAIMLAAPMLCLPGAVNITGITPPTPTTCEVGTCATPGTLNAGGSTSGSFDFFYTLANTDKYEVFGSYSAAYLGGTTSLFFNTNPIYIGNSTHTASAADTISIDLLQDFNFTTGSPDGTYHFGTTLTPVGGPGSCTSAFQSIDGQMIPEAGPYCGPGSKHYSESAMLAGLTEPLTDILNHTYNFAAGTSAIPEPADMGLLAIGLLGFAIPAFLRRKRTQGAVK